MERKNPYYVLGWTTYDEDDFVDGTVGMVGHGGNKEMDEAVANDILCHDYVFTGTDHQDGAYCAPVLNDYRVVRYSTRHFGRVMAKGQGLDPDKEYLTYAWDALWSDDDLRVFPPETLTYENPAPPQYAFSLSPDSFEELNKTMLHNGTLIDYEKEEDMEEVPDRDTYYLYPVPLPNDRHYWINDELTFSCGEKSLSPRVKKLLSYPDMKGFDQDISERVENTDNHYVYDRDLIASVAEKGPFLLLGVQ